MSMTITVELDDLEEKVMRYLAADPEAWVTNFVQSRIFAGKQEIYASEVKRMTADPDVENIPANVDVVVTAANITYANAQPEIPDMTPPPV